MILRTDYSDACPLATQRRYHMQQRSSIFFWLLLIATLAVDAVAIAWLMEDIEQVQTAILFIAMAYAQVSILCVWAVLLHATFRTHWIIPFAAGFIVALIITTAEMQQRSSPNFHWEQLLAFTSLMWVHATVTCLLLWLLKPTRVFAGYLDNTNQWTWRFTTKHLLILSTCLPVLVIVFKYSAIVRSGVSAHGFWMFVAWVAGNAVLLVAIAAIVQGKWTRVLRLAACAGAALAIGLFLHWSTPELPREFNTFAVSLIQAFALWAWLETLRPRGCAEVAGVDESQSMELDP